MTYCTILCYASNDNDNDNNNDSTIIVFPYTVYYAILYYTIYCTVLPLLYCTCTVLYYYCITIYCTMLGRTSSPRPSRSTSAGYICYMCYTYICVYVCMYIYIYIYIYMCVCIYIYIYTHINYKLYKPYKPCTYACMLGQPAYRQGDDAAVPQNQGLLLRNSIVLYNIVYYYRILLS